MNNITTEKTNNQGLIASDIFGISTSFQTLKNQLDQSQNLSTVSPYEQVHSEFASESEAYQAFQARGGIEAYIEKISGIMQGTPEITKFVGFSAGAAALYRAMSLIPRADAQLFLFYPGQIRFYLQQAPSSPCTIIFPEHESHFCVNQVISQLKPYPQLTIQQTSYQHGFMNSDSKGFDKDAYQHYCAFLKEALNN